MPDVIATLDQVGKLFPRAKRPAVEGVSAEIRTGLVTGLVGPDGAGKTTLMRLMAGLLAPTSGRITIDGGDPIADAKRLREHIGYMPQKFGLYEDLSVQENMDLYGDLRGVLGEERAVAFKRLLQFTDLSRFTERLAGKLSGGMKQKLGLACALLGHPRLLLLDEPGVGVDPISRRELWRMVHELIAQGMAVVWSTAYLEEAELCEHVILLNEGKLVYAGPPAAMTGRMRGRCLQIRNFQGSRRQLLTRALRRPEVLDGVIQGHDLRIVLRAGAACPSLIDLKAGESATGQPGQRPV